MGDRSYDDEDPDQGEDENSYPPEDEDEDNRDSGEADHQKDSRPDGFFDSADEFGTIVPDDNVF